MVHVRPTRTARVSRSRTRVTNNSHLRSGSAGSASATPVASAAQPNGAIAIVGAQSPRPTQTLSRRLGWDRRIRARLVITDSVILAAAFLAVGFWLWQLDATAITARGELARVVVPPLIAFLTWFICLAVLRSRDPKVLGHGPTEYQRVTNSAGIAFLVMATLALFTDSQELRPQLLLTFPVVLLALLVSRREWRKWLVRQRLVGEWASHSLITGNMQEIEYVLKRITDSADTTHHIVAACVTGGTGKLSVHGHPVPIVQGGDVAEVATRLGADTVILAAQADSRPEYVTELSRSLEGTCAELVLVSRLAEAAGPRISMRPVAGLPLVNVRIPTFDGGRHIVKRMFDIVISAAALAVIAIAALPIAMAIKLDSRGPVFFKQQRVGRDGRVFEMIKFRTMRTDAESLLAELQSKNEGSGPLFKMQNDPRVTRVGSFLRKHSLDELPQFWNALKGDMSVVGPRPPLPHEATSYDGTVKRRLYLKPGITGLWQISGRSDLSWNESVRLDLRYVESWSVMQDLMIVFKTAKLVVKPSGAY